MNTIYTKHKLRSVRSSMSRFFAIFGIVALGAGFLSGLMAATPDMRQSVDAYYDKYDLMDIRVVSTLGLTDDDVRAVKGADGVLAVEPAYSKDVLAGAPRDPEIPTRFMSLPGSMNRLELREGRLPEKAGECVIEIPVNLSRDIKIGETLTLSGDEDLSDSLSATTYTVVGVVRSTCFFSVDRENTSVGNGTIGLFVYIPEDNFTLEAYTDLLVQVKGAKNQTAYTNGYTDAVAPVTERLETLGKTQAQRRTDEIVGEATAKLNDAKKEYEKAKQEAEDELNEARDKIDNGKRELADGENALAQGWQELADGEAALEKQRADVGAQLTEKQEELETARAEWIHGQTEWNQAKQQLDEAALALAKGREQLAQLEAAGMTEQAEALGQELEKQQAAYDAGIKQLNEQKTTLDAAGVQIEEGQKQLAEASAQAQAALAEGEQQLAASRQTLEASQAELADARQKLADAEKDYARGEREAKEKLADGQREIDQAAEDIAAIEPAEWYVLDRDSIAAYNTFGSNADKVAAIAVVFPVFFCLVAALVALTTMTRMVEEERIQIGTLKALGYSNAAIMGKYTLYAGVATSLGCIVGMALGFQVFPRVIWNAYQILYDQPPLIASFHVGMAAVIFGILFVSIMLATLAACYSILRQSAAQLLLPRAPKAGKRILLEHIPFLWKRFKFTQKVTARNIFRYKKRFFMTVLGVAGCTALLVTGFGMSNSITGIVDRQFGEIYRYSLMVGIKEADAVTQNKDLAAILEDKDTITDYLPMAQPSVDVVGERATKTAYICVPQDAERLAEYVTLRERKGHAPLSLSDDGVLVTEKLAKQLGLSVGDTIRLKDTDNRSATITVSGITEHYVQSYIYMTPAAYEKAFHIQPDFKVLAVKPESDGLDRDGLSTRLLGTGDVSLVQFTDTLRDSLHDTLGSVNYIVLVLIICAGLLAFVVLYNLTNINITERQKELATIKVLGFYDREVSSYIFRETTILMLIGTVVGLFVGIALHAFVVQTAEVEMVMFIRDIKWTSYVYAAALTILFSLGVNLTMKPRLRKIDMVESMKAGE